VQIISRGLRNIAFAPPAIRNLKRIIRAGLFAICLASAAAIAITYPTDMDPRSDESFRAEASQFYDQAYSTETESLRDPAPTAAAAEPLTAKDHSYVEFDRLAALAHKIPDAVGKFVDGFELRDKKVLEVGAGSGLLQDVVEDYTALDIAPSARRFFHKPFVAASATQMPFKDNTFDALWSIWVLEHVPNPEKALLEMRRVVKPRGYIFLQPTFDVDRYAGQGYRVRAYADFGLWGKIKKATIPIADSKAFYNLQARQVRLLRSLGSRLGAGPSRLHFIKLDANYHDYWVADSDACTSVSRHELYLWFNSRGDRCVNCRSEWRSIFGKTRNGSIIIQVMK